MSLFEDASIDDRLIEFDGEHLTVREALAGVMQTVPDPVYLLTAAQSMDDATPDSLRHMARLERARESLIAAGLCPLELVHAWMRAILNLYRPLYQPPLGSFANVLLNADAALLERVGDDFLASPNLNSGQRNKGELVVWAMARAGVAIPKRFDALIAFEVEPEYARVIAGALPIARRQARFDELFGESLDGISNQARAIYRLSKALAIVDLVGDGYAARVRRRLLGLSAEAHAGRDSDRVMELLAQLERGPWEPPSRGEDGFTDHSRRSYVHWTEQLADIREQRRLGPVAESRKDLSVDVDAPELTSLAAWLAASATRREAIACDVAVAVADLGIVYHSVGDYGVGPIAVFELKDTGAALSLVPGGVYLRGFSEREASLVKAAQSVRRGSADEYGSLLERTPEMRPTSMVRVAPVLVFQEPTVAESPGKATKKLQSLPFRLMSEAEHEHAQRGGVESALTWRGDTIPDSAWMKAVMRQTNVVRNGFGLARLGLYPEVLADVWYPSYEGAPVDGSARTGSGPRVVRGGAAMSYPWQACGEWQALANAERGSAERSQYFLSIRPALGVICQ